MERNDFWRLAELAEQLAAKSNDELLAAARMHTFDRLEELVWSFEIVRDDLGEAPHPLDAQRAFALEQITRMLTAYRRVLVDRRVQQGELFTCDAAPAASPRERRSNRRFAGRPN